MTAEAPQRLTKPEIERLRASKALREKMGDLFLPDRVKVDHSSIGMKVVDFGDASVNLSPIAVRQSKNVVSWSPPLNEEAVVTNQFLAVRGMFHIKLPPPTERQTEQPKPQLALRVTNSHGRGVDFNLGEADPRTVEFVQAHLGIEHGCVVEVPRVDRERAVDGVYNAKLFRYVMKPVVNPTREQLAKIPGGTRLALQGRITAISSDARTLRVAVSERDVADVRTAGFTQYVADGIRNPLQVGNSVNGMVELGSNGFTARGDFHRSVRAARESMLSPLEKSLLQFVSLSERVVDRNLSQDDIDAYQNAFTAWREKAQSLPAGDLERVTIEETLRNGTYIPDSIRFFYANASASADVQALATAGLHLQHYTREQVLDFASMVAEGSIAMGEGEGSPFRTIMKVTAEHFEPVKVIAVFRDGIIKRMDQIRNAEDGDSLRSNATMLEDMVQALSQRQIEGATSLLFHVANFSQIGKPDEIFQLRHHAIDALLRNVKAKLVVNADRLAELAVFEDGLRSWKNHGLTFEESNKVEYLLARLEERRVKEAKEVVPTQAAQDRSQRGGEDTGALALGKSTGALPRRPRGATLSGGEPEGVKQRFERLAFTPEVARTSLSTLRAGTQRAEAEGADEGVSAVGPLDDYIQAETERFYAPRD